MQMGFQAFAMEFVIKFKDSYWSFLEVSKFAAIEYL